MSSLSLSLSLSLCVLYHTVLLVPVWETSMNMLERIELAFLHKYIIQNNLCDGLLLIVPMYIAMRN